MADPWLVIVGLGEDGPAGLPEASREAIAGAEIIFGAPRHLALIGAAERGRSWPVPFDTDPVLAEKGRNVVVLASGDPFWHGVGGTLAARLAPGEWRALPAPGTFSLAAARMGWRLEETACLGLHAAPFARLMPLLGRDLRALCLMRDGAAVSELADWLCTTGFGASHLTVLEALGGPRERIRRHIAEGFDLPGIVHPVAVALEARGAGGLPGASGLPDELFAHDGQITKRPIRALTLSALAPRRGEVLWDLGAGSGSISVAWCLAAAGARAHAVEQQESRCTNIRANAERFGLAHRLALHPGDWADGLDRLPDPDAIFLGGGANPARIETILKRVAAPGRTVRLVVNAVTLETEALIGQLHGRFGGTLLRIDLAEAAPLGRLRGWVPARPILQWSGTI